MSMNANRHNTPEYRQYLHSPTWAELRNRVLERDKHLCQGCLRNRATQVHHRTYQNLFQEFAFELEAVCDDCHIRIHGPTGLTAQRSGNRLIAALEKMERAVRRKKTANDDGGRDAA